MQNYYQPDELIDNRKNSYLKMLYTQHYINCQNLTIFYGGDHVRVFFTVANN